MFNIWIINSFPTWWASNWLLNGLVSYYKMDTNWSFPDAHGSNPWTINGATFTASGKINWAYDFDWNNDYIDFAAYTLSTISVSTWVKFDTLPTASCLYSTISVSPNIRIFECRTQWNKLQLAMNDWSFSWLNWTTSLTTGVFYNIIFTYNSITGNRKIYLNGSLEASDTFTSWLSFNWTTDINIWAYQSWFRFTNWIIDENWIWSKELTDADALAIYNSSAWLSYDDFTT